MDEDKTDTVCLEELLSSEGFSRPPAPFFDIFETPAALVEEMVAALAECRPPLFAPR